MSMEVVNAVGRRKAAVARVYVKPGKGNITINQKPLDTYFPLEIFQYVVKQPLLVTSTTENYDITITLDGGGIKGQAEAARLGIARALCAIDAEMRPVLKKNGFMTRVRLSVRNPVSPVHVASSSSASVNICACGAQSGYKFQRLRFWLHYSVIAPLRKIAGIVKDTTAAIDVKRIKTDLNS